jgi:hypothetical protein
MKLLLPLYIFATVSPDDGLLTETCSEVLEKRNCFYNKSSSVWFVYGITAK